MAEQELPLVSCVMVTVGRPEYVRQSIHYFSRQDHPSKELIIVHEQETDLPSPMPDDPRIRTLRVRPGMSIGEKRNAGAREALGGLVAQWDDDDWYGTGRLSAQIAPLLEGSADITGLRRTPLFLLRDWTFWQCPPEVHTRMFVEDVHGGTLVYRRQVWEQLAHYPATNLREDADFLVAAMSQGARLARLPAHGLFLYVRHGANTWRFQPQAEGWIRAGEPEGFAEARDFYRARSAEAPAGVVSSPSGAARVSCIMPTFERPQFVPRAIRHFLAQTHLESELIIVDDGRASVEHLVPSNPRIRYLRLPDRQSVGRKRNLACEQATGDLILHWDDDDWMSPQWIALQAKVLLREQADVCGLSRPYFYDPVHRQAFRYEYPASGRPWVHGGTLCYTRELWRREPFEDINQGEDVRFLWSRQPKKVFAHEHAQHYVAWLHTNNTSAKPRSGPRWRRCPVADVERVFISARKDT